MNLGCTKHLSYRPILIFRSNIEDFLSDELKLQVYDYDKFSSNDFLGQMKFLICALGTTDTIDQWFPLLGNN